MSERRPEAKADLHGTGVQMVVPMRSQDDYVSFMTKESALALACDLIAAATGYEPVNHDGSYIGRDGAPKHPAYMAMKLVSVDFVAEGLPPAAREAYLRSRGRS